MKKYLAFISYRHSEYDKKIASGLHRTLELLHMPKQTAYSKKRRLFRDEEELPTSSNLGNDITAALGSSEYLIVICSPRLPESRWCLSEIDYFISHGMKHRILPVLIEGDKKVSVPESIQDLDITVDLTGINHAENIASADVKNISLSGNRKIKRKINESAVRLLSSMTDVPAGDIERSEAVSKITKTVIAMLCAAAVFAGFAVYSGYIAGKINNNNEEIKLAATESEKARTAALEKRDEAILSRAKTLAEESKEMIDNGDYDGAIINILPVLPSDENPDYPLSAEAMAVLRTAMAIAQPTYEYARTLNLETDEDSEIYEKILNIKSEAGYIPEEDTVHSLGINLNNIKSIDSSKLYVALVNNYGILEVYHLSSNKLIVSSDKKYKSVYFTDDPGELYAVTDSGNIELLETKSLRVIRTIDFHNKAKGIYACTNKNYLLITCEDSIEIYRHDNGRYIQSFLLDSEPDFAIFADYSRLFSISRGEQFYVVFSDHVDLYRTKQTVDSEISDFIPFIDESFRQTIQWYASDLDGSAVYIQDAGGPVFKWDVKTGELLWKTFPKEYFTVESGFTTNLSYDGKAIWYPQGALSTFKKLDTETGEVLFEIKPEVDAYVYDA